MRWLGLMAAILLGSVAAIAQSNGETIIVIRHGEKRFVRPDGQMNCQGLNRALALPSVLAKYGHPDAFFAPNPSVQIPDGVWMPGMPVYSYVRPLATIEPYAISLDMPVNTQIAAKDIDTLRNTVLQPSYARSVIVIAWEHENAQKFVESVFQALGKNPKDVPSWGRDDYDSVYVLHITGEYGKKRTLDFHLDHENLNGHLPETCPASPAR